MKAPSVHSFPLFQPAARAFQLTRERVKFGEVIFKTYGILIIQMQFCVV